MALVAKDGKYRSGKHEFKVRKAMVVQKNFPRFIRPGDSLKMGAIVVNQTGLGGAFRCSISSNLLRGKESTRVVNLAPGESKEVTFFLQLNTKKYSALKKKLLLQNRKKKSGGENKREEPEGILVKGEIAVKPLDMEKMKGAGFKNSDVIDRLTYEFSVKEQPPEEAFSVGGFTKEKTEEFLVLPRRGEIIPSMGGLELSLSSSALTGLDQAFTFFKSNPYFCLEQRASAFLLTISAGELLKDFSLGPPAKLEYNFWWIKRLFLGEVDEFQNSDGGFRAWKDGTYRESYPYLSAYVTFVLVTAGQQGYDVDKDVLEKAIRYLKGYVRQPRKDGYAYVLETFSMINYLFAAAGDYDDGLTDLLLAHEKKLSIRGRAYLLLAIARGEGLNDYKKNKDTLRLMEYIKNRMDITTRKISFREATGSNARAYYSRGSTLGAVMRAMMYLDRHNPLIPKMVSFAIAAKKSSLWMDSHSAGNLALALKEYHEIFEKTSGFKENFTGTVTLETKKLFSSSFYKYKLQLFNKSISFDELYANGSPGKQYPLGVESAKNNRLYYTATLRYFPRLKVIKPRDEGIEISREILDMERATEKEPRGRKVTGDLRRGTIYLARVRVITPKPCYNALIVDPLSSNVEIVNTSFKTEKGSLAKYTKEKGDGSYDYWWEDVKPITEYRDDKVVITADYLSPGMHTYYYLIRPTITGTALRPAGTAKLMYEPEVFGRTGGGVITVH